MVMEGMLVQPNSMSFPIMPNFGLMPPAKGAINIKLLRGEKLKDLPLYVEVEIRKGRGQYSETVEPIAGKAEYGEEFNLIVSEARGQQGLRERERGRACEWKGSHTVMQATRRDVVSIHMCLYA